MTSSSLEPGHLRELDEIEQITPRLFTLLREIANDVIGRSPAKSQLLNDPESFLSILQKLPTFFCQRLFNCFRRSPHRLQNNLDSEGNKFVGGEFRGNLYELCIQLISQILMRMWSFAEEASGNASTVINMLFAHLEDHSLCLGSCLALYRFFYFSKEARHEFRYLEGINFVISRIKKVALPHTFITRGSPDYNALVARNIFGTQPSSSNVRSQGSQETQCYKMVNTLHSHQRTAGGVVATDEQGRHFSLRRKKGFFKRRLSDPAILAQVNQTSEFDIDPGHQALGDNNEEEYIQGYSADREVKIEETKREASSQQEEDNVPSLRQFQSIPQDGNMIASLRIFSIQNALVGGHGSRHTRRQIRKQLSNRNRFVARAGIPSQSLEQSAILAPNKCYDSGGPASIRMIPTSAPLEPQQPQEIQLDEQTHRAIMAQSKSQAVQILKRPEDEHSQPQQKSQKLPLLQSPLSSAAQKKPAGLKQRPKVPALNLSQMQDSSYGGGAAYFSRSSRRAEGQVRSASSSRTHKSGMFDTMYRERSAGPPVATWQHNRQGSDAGGLTSNLATAVAAGEMDTSIFPDQHHYNLTDIYMSGADKLRSLAIQIGQSCLTNDLASLLAQRRDFELERHARGFSQELITPDATPEGKLTPHQQDEEEEQKKPPTRRNKLNRSFSMSNFDSIQANFLLKQEEMQSLLQDENIKKGTVKKEVSQAEKRREQAQSKLKARVRLVLLNLLYHMTRDLSLEELRFTATPLNVLYCHLSSEHMARQRFKSEAKALEMDSTRASDSEGDSCIDIHCDGSIQKLQPPKRQLTQLSYPEQGDGFLMNGIEQFQNTYSSYEDNEGNHSGLIPNLAFGCMDPRPSLQDTNSRFSLSMTRPYESTSQFLSTLNDPTQVHPTPHLAGSQTAVIKPERTAEFGEAGTYRVQGQLDKTEEFSGQVSYTPDQNQADRFTISGAKLSSSKLHITEGRSVPLPRQVSQFLVSGHRGAAYEIRYMLKFKSESKVILSILKRYSGVCEKAHRSMVQASLANMSKDAQQSISPHIESTLRRTQAFPHQIFGVPPTSLSSPAFNLLHRKILPVPITYSSIIKYRRQTQQQASDQVTQFSPPAARSSLLPPPSSSGGRTPQLPLFTGQPSSGHHQAHTSLSSLQQPQPSLAAAQDLMVPSCIQDARSTTSIWQNGIAFSNFYDVGKERVRRQSDQILFRIDKRIRHILTHFSHHSISFALETQNQLSLLAQYLRKAKSRVLLLCFTDTLLEALLMLKKVILDLAGDTAHSFFLALGSAYPSSTSPQQQGNWGAAPSSDPPLTPVQGAQISTGGVGLQKGCSPQEIKQLEGKHPSLTSWEVNSFRAAKYKYALEMRIMISSYLRVLSEVIQGIHIAPQLSKLYNEIFIADEQWNEMLRNYLIGLFTVDLNIFIPETQITSDNPQTLYYHAGQGVPPVYISPATSPSPTPVNKQEDNINPPQIEQPQGIPAIIWPRVTLLDFDETVDLAAHPLAEQVALNGFMQLDPSLQNQEMAAYLAHRRHGVLRKLMLGARASLEYYDAVAQFSKKMIAELQESMREKNPKNAPRNSFAMGEEQISYWKKSLRKSLLNFTFLTSPSRGVLPKYLKRNGTLMHSNKVPIHFRLTRCVLRLLRRIFDIPNRISKHLFTNEMALFYVRTHYVGFVRLYNKVPKKAVRSTPKIETPFSLDLLRRSQALKELQDSKMGHQAFEITAAQRGLLTLAKLHLKCLFSIAKNRNQDTRRVFYQFRVLDFLAAEYDLEHDVAARQDRFAKLREQTRSAIPEHLPVQLSKDGFVVKDEKGSKPSRGGGSRQQPVKVSKNVSQIDEVKEEDTMDAITQHDYTDYLENSELHPKQSALGSLNSSALEDQSTFKSRGNLHRGNHSPYADKFQTPSGHRIQAHKKVEPSATLQAKDKNLLPQELIQSPAKTMGYGSPLNDFVDLRRKGNDEPEKKKEKPKMTLPFAKSALDDIMHPPSTLFSKAQRNLRAKQKTGSRRSTSPLSTARREQEQHEWMEYEEQTEEAIEKALLQGKTQSHESLAPMAAKMRSRAEAPSPPSSLGLTGDGNAFSGNISLRQIIESRAQNPDQYQEVKRELQQKSTLLKKVESLHSLRSQRGGQSSDHGANSPRQLYKEQDVTRGLESIELHTEPKQSQEVATQQLLNLKRGKFAKKADHIMKKQMQSHQGSGDQRKVALPRLKINLGSRASDSVEQGSKNSAHSGSEPGYSPRIKKTEVESPYVEYAPNSDGGSDRSQHSDYKKYYDYEDSDSQEWMPPPPPKKKALAIPGLSLGGLGFSAGAPPPGVGEPLKKAPVIPPLFDPNKVVQVTDEQKQKQFKKRTKTPDKVVKEEKKTKAEQKRIERGSPGQQVLSREERSQKKKPPLREIRKKVSERLREEASSSQAGKTDQVLNDIDAEEEAFYCAERGGRPLYADQELHVLMLSLAFCLMLKPTRGTLDQFYCETQPLIAGKTNVLYLLHEHLNHPANLSILPRLLRKVAKLRPPLAGQRLLKLLCTRLFDPSMYRDQKLLARGAYGTVYSCTTGLAEPKTVAIKILPLPKSISERCVLHDIFTEIAVLQELRLQRGVSELYDYGVDSDNYFIVMREYACSLRDWRLAQPDPDLQILLAIFRDVLSTVAMLHAHRVTHYDLKCDNVLLLSNPNTGSVQSRKETASSATAPAVTIADFGESHMFVSEVDQFYTTSKGTLNIQSPEMVTLSRNTKVDTDFYDRRKKVGTNRLSDIWSLGCLFYQLLTCDYLFDQFEVWNTVVGGRRASTAQGTHAGTSAHQELLPPHKRAKMKNNWYLIDFLLFMLVRDPSRRPSVDTVLKRFEHVHALLAPKGALPSQPRIDEVHSLGFEEVVPVQGLAHLQQLLKEAVSLMHPVPTAAVIPERERPPFSPAPLLTRILKDVYICAARYFLAQSPHLFILGITHIVIPLHLLTPSQRLAVQERFDVLYLEVPQSAHPVTSFYHTPAVMDFLRRAKTVNGAVLFCEPDDPVRYPLIRETLLIALSTLFQCSGYETATLIKSQVIFFEMSVTSMSPISRWSLLSSRLRSYLSTYPRFSCECGACLLVLKRRVANLSNLPSKPCSCSHYYKQQMDCPSGGCADFLFFAKVRNSQCQKVYNKEWSSLRWGFVERQDFFIGPDEGFGEIQNHDHRRVLGLSDFSSFVPVRVVEKKSYDWHSSSRFQRWTLFMCSACHVWTHAVRDSDSSIALLLNNLKKGKEVQEVENAAKGILSPKSADPQNALSGSSRIRVPVLRNISLQSFQV